MSDNTMREGKLWAFLRDSIHEAYKKLSTTGTSTEYHAMLDSIASKIADDVDARRVALVADASANSLPLLTTLQSAPSLGQRPNRSRRPSPAQVPPQT